MALDPVSVGLRAALFCQDRIILPAPVLKSSFL
jgi:hypothetical protein